MLTKELLLKVAKRIFNPKTGKYLKLCKRELVTGKGKTKMHCALGELYFAATGDEPRAWMVTDTAISALAGGNPIWDSLQCIVDTNDDADRYEVRARRVAAKMRELAEIL